jgi:feruloyl esterase
MQLYCKIFVLVQAALWTCYAIGQQSCERLTQLKLNKAKIIAATIVPAGPFKFPAPTMIAAASVDLAAYCRVEGAARPTDDSEIKFEIWMPVNGWNGKYLQVGNGGFAGRIPTVAMTAPLVRGYASGGTDDGHTGPERPDASWATGHPEKIIDFGYRAVHQTTLQAKAIIRAFYGKSPTHA